LNFYEHGRRRKKPQTESEWHSRSEIGMKLTNGGFMAIFKINVKNLVVG